MSIYDKLLEDYLEKQAGGSTGSRVRPRVGAKTPPVEPAPFPDIKPSPSNKTTNSRESGNRNGARTRNSHHRRNNGVVETEANRQSQLRTEAATRRIEANRAARREATARNMVENPRSLADQFNVGGREIVPVGNGAALLRAKPSPLQQWLNDTWKRFKNQQKKKGPNNNNKQPNNNNKQPNKPPIKDWVNSVLENGLASPTIGFSNGFSKGWNLNPGVNVYKEPFNVGGPLANTNRIGKNLYNAGVVTGAGVGGSAGLVSGAAKLVVNSRLARRAAAVGGTALSIDDLMKDRSDSWIQYLLPNAYNRMFGKPDSAVPNIWSDVFSGRANTESGYIPPNPNNNNPLEMEIVPDPTMRIEGLPGSSNGQFDVDLNTFPLETGPDTTSRNNFAPMKKVAYSPFTFNALTGEISTYDPDPVIKLDVCGSPKLPKDALKPRKPNFSIAPINPTGTSNKSSGGIVDTFTGWIDGRVENGVKATGAPEAFDSLAEAGDELKNTAENINATANQGSTVMGNLAKIAPYALAALGIGVPLWYLIRGASKGYDEGRSETNDTTRSLQAWRASKQNRDMDYDDLQLSLSDPDKVTDDELDEILKDIKRKRRRKQNA